MQLLREKSKIITTVLCTMLLVSMAGCATIEGAGKDIEKAGEAVQDAADGE